MEPTVPISVDPDSGIWRVDGQPMVLIPRRYWVFVQMEIERQYGMEAGERLMLNATTRAARIWCEKEAETHNLLGVEVFRHYMQRISARGTGQFSIAEIDPSAGTAEIRVDHSIYVAEYGRDAGRNVCHAYGGAFVGGMEYVAASAGLGDIQLAADEVQCAANGADHCRFIVKPKG